LKVAVHVIDRRDSRREFQIVGPETQNALSPNLSPGSRYWIIPGQVVDESGGKDNDDVATSGGRCETTRSVERSTDTAVPVNGHQDDHPVCQRLQLNTSLNNTMQCAIYRVR